MNQVIPHLLWFGHAGDVRDFRTLFELGIQAVMQVAAEEAPVLLPRDLILCRFPLLDGAENRPELLRLAATTLAQLLRDQVPTLVCCSAGLSRSPALAAAALALVMHKPFLECLELVRAHRPCDIHALFAQMEALLSSSPG